MQLDNINGFLLTTKFAINMKRTQLGNDHDTVEARSSDGAIPRIRQTPPMRLMWLMRSLPTRDT